MALVLLAPGCALLHDNVKGSFACKAPDGTCAPSSVIDDAALAAIAGGADPDTMAPMAPGRARMSHRVRSGSRGVRASGATSAQAGGRTLRIVFLPHVDRFGQLHEKAVVQVALNDGGGETGAGEVAEPGMQSEVRQAELGSPTTARAITLGTPGLLDLAGQAPELADTGSATGPAVPGGGAARAGGTSVSTAHASAHGPTAGAASPAPIAAIQAEVAAALAPAVAPRKAEPFPGKVEQ